MPDLTQSGETTTGALFVRSRPLPVDDVGRVVDGMYDMSKGLLKEENRELRASFAQLTGWQTACFMHSH